MAHRAGIALDSVHLEGPLIWSSLGILARTVLSVVPSALGRLRWPVSVLCGFLLQVAGTSTKAELNREAAWHNRAWHRRGCLHY